MNKEFINAIDDLVKEKGISKDVLIGYRICSGFSI